MNSSDFTTFNISEVILHIVSGVSVNGNDFKANKNEKGVLKTGCVKHGVFIPTENKRILESEIKRAKVNPVKNTIILNRSNTQELVGMVGYVKKDYKNLFLSDKLWLIQANEEIVDTKYFVYLLSSSKYSKKISSYATGTSASMKNISQKTFENIQIQLPPLNIQYKVKNYLSSLEKKIQFQEEKINLLKVQKKGYMQKIFKQEIRFKDENGREYSEWKVKKLKDVTTLANKTRVGNPEAYNLLSVKLHLNGVEATDKKPNPTKNGRPYYIRNSGELIIGRQNFHNGGIAIVDENTDGYVASNAISSFNVINNNNIHYIYLYISQVDYYKRVGYFMEGTGQKEISEAILSDLVIEMPELKEQEKIADFFFEFDKKVHHEQKKLDLLKEQKKGFMQQMFA
ncbi:restriction endonuclease subunit S [Bacillus cereus]|uniref:restriction endonuclease subunit S n=1 Tax=Bacillus cereus TaxID=1396 RepID=UPI0015D4FA14|nr:restriction endonuclease subunit S [Bacillus cereus]